MTGEGDLAIERLVGGVGSLLAVPGPPLAFDRRPIAVASAQHFERQLLSNLVDDLLHDLFGLIKACLGHLIQLGFTDADHDLLGLRVAFDRYFQFGPRFGSVAATTAQFRLRRRGPILLPLLNLWLHQPETAPVWMTPLAFTKNWSQF